MFFLICITVGFASALVGSIVGLGGGVILVPILLVLYEYNDSFSWASAHQIVGLSLIIMIFTALSSSITYSRKQRIDYKSAFLFVIGGIPGGIIGSFSNQYVNTDSFSIYFGILMIMLFMLFFIKRNKKVSNEHPTSKKWRIYREKVINNKVYTYSFSPIYVFIVAFLVGCLSGFFGIGGGSLTVPVMILFFGFPAHIATATSMFMILFLSVFSSVTHFYLGHITWEYVWLFIPGAFIGGIVGAKINQRLSGPTVEWLLKILLLIIGFRLIWQGIG
ncbi:sulfite exporter TauE/SafE family protein [Aquibacillus kalidii]|uniref:sulfite exporter TauE/SafE family protein n=1 Tax=Aquibacillus kalidii TaxID=2762597 RepID=UPI001646C05D|nr:sulfite exporter TauE/SafE family protein [Aquibacillus kalidii]